MKKSIIYTALTVILAFAFSSMQGVQAAAEQQKEDKVFDIVENPPKFVGGETALYEFITKNIEYPKLAEENNIMGRVIVQFVIDEKGKVRDPKVLRSVDPILDKEAIRVINAMPDWIPGTQGGKPVKVKYVLPINFSPNINRVEKNSNKESGTFEDKRHLPASTGLVGMWRQSGAIDSNGTIIEIPSGNYKVINPDGTFYTFIVWGEKRPTQIGLYGTYTITSDSTYTEKIIKHGINPRMSGTSSELRYRFLDENLLLLEYKNEALNRWIPEIWRRVELANTERVEFKTL